MGHATDGPRSRGGGDHVLHIEPRYGYMKIMGQQSGICALRDNVALESEADIAIGRRALCEIGRPGQNKAWLSSAGTLTKVSTDGLPLGT